MQRGWHKTAKIAVGLLVGAACAVAQYTISARPGAVNYIEGSVTRNGEAVGSSLRNVFLGANDVLETADGKAEVLLTPGVFLRVGSNSQIRMISPSLTHTQLEVVDGEAMVEVSEMEKGNDIEIIDHGASVTLGKAGLYRFTAGEPPTAAVLEGKATVRFGDSKIEMGKNRETVLSEYLKAQKLDNKKQDDLYAWSNVRAEYDSAASVHMARSVYDTGYNSWGSSNGYAYNGFGSPGWYWNAGFSSWAWLPGGAGAFYSPFGYGFYSPGIVSYAPVVYVPTNHGMWHGNRPPTGRNGQVPVGVNPNAPPAVGGTAGSAWANHRARVEAARSLNSSGFTNMNGHPVTSLPGQNSAAGSGSGWAGRNPNAASGQGWAGRNNASSGGNWEGRSAGGAGWSGGHPGGGGGASPATGASHAGGGFSGGGGGGGHAGGGGGGSRSK